MTPSTTGLPKWATVVSKAEEEARWRRFPLFQPCNMYRASRRRKNLCLLLLRDNMLCNNLLGFRNILSFFALAFCVGRARLHAYLSRHWGIRITRTRPRGEGLHDQLGP